MNNQELIKSDDIINFLETNLKKNDFNDDFVKECLKQLDPFLTKQQSKESDQVQK
jgi:hypothetical protein